MLAIACTLAAIVLIETNYVAARGDAQGVTDCGVSGDFADVNMPVSLQVREGERIALIYDLGRQRRMFRTSTVRYAINPRGEGAPELRPDSFLPVRLSDVRRLNDNRNIPSQVFDAEARIVGGDEVQLRACIDTTQLGAGTYRTAMQVVDPDIDHTPISLTVSVQSASALPLYVALVLSWLVGSVLIFLRTADDTAGPGRPSDPFAALRSKRLWLSIIVGMIATIPAGLIVALEDADFGVSITDYLQVFLTSLAAFVLGEGVVGATAGVVAWSRADDRDE